VTREFLAITNDNWGFTTRYIQSDGEKGLGQEWKALITAKGITFNSSPPDTPDQNGLAERSGGVIISIARKLRAQSRLPHKLWPYLVAHATRLLNRIPVQRKEWLTPFQMVHVRKPNLSHLKIVGSLAYVLIKSKRDRPARAKLRDKAIMGWLVGFSATNIYKVWIPHLNRVIISRDVQIDEKVMYDPALVTVPEGSGHAVSITLNEVDLDESDAEIFPTFDTTTVNPDLVQYEVPSGIFLPPPAPLQTRTTQAQTGRPSSQLLPTPFSLESRQPSVSSHNPPGIRPIHQTANSLQTHGTAWHVQKRVRRQAHQLRLERAKLGHQVAHAFAQLI